jgi:hypothetical protein
MSPVKLQPARTMDYHVHAKPHLGAVASSCMSGDA